MESKSRSGYQYELENLREKIAKLKKENYDDLVFILRNKIGCIKNIDGFHTYMKFKHEVMNLDELGRPEKSSWPMLLMEIFMPYSVDWSARSRLDKFFEFQDYIMEYESALKAKESNVDKYNESINNDNLSSECEEMDSTFS